MVKRFRMVAGPNGSGKSTLVKRLAEDYKVNFYTFINADDIFAHVVKSGAFSPKFPVEKEELVRYAEASSYDESVKAMFRGDSVAISDDCVRFAPEAINSYTIALFANFLQDRFLDRGESFSQETVFSHPSKIAALKRAKELGYRTYLYFVATPSSAINKTRVAMRVAQGGHNVPEDKIILRYSRSLAQLKEALPYLSRAFFFDNGGPEMRYLGQYSAEEGLSFKSDALPNWLRVALA